MGGGERGKWEEGDGVEGSVVCVWRGGEPAQYSHSFKLRFHRSSSSLAFLSSSSDRDMRAVRNESVKELRRER